MAPLSRPPSRRTRSADRAAGASPARLRAAAVRAAAWWLALGLLGLSLLVPGPATAEHPTWMKLAEAVGRGDYGQISVLPDGRVLVCAIARRPDGERIHLVTRLDSAGRGEWQAWTPRESREGFGGCTFAPDGTSYAVGPSSSHSPDTGYRAWFLKLGADGRREWEILHDAGIHEQPDTAILAAPDGGAVVAGFSGGGTTWFLKLSPEGNVEWQTYFGVPGAWHLFRGVAIDAEGRVFALGSSSHRSPFPAWLGITDSQGSLSSSRIVSSPERVDFHGAAIHEDGSYQVVGTSWSAALRGLALAGFDPDGSLVWFRNLRHPRIAFEFPAAAAMPDGGIVFVAEARIQGPTAGDPASVLGRVSRDGELLWIRNLVRNPVYWFFRSVAVLPDGRILVAGGSLAEGGIRVFRLNPDGRALQPCDLIRDLEDYTFEAEDAVMEDVPIRSNPLDSTYSNVETEFETLPLSTRDLCCPYWEPPLEVSGPDSPRPLLFASPTRFEWADGDSADSCSFDVYHGRIADLRSGLAPTCRRSGVTDPFADLPENPGPGDAFYVLVGGRNLLGTGSLGTDSLGNTRTPDPPCP